MASIALIALMIRAISAPLVATSFTIRHLFNYMKGAIESHCPSGRQVVQKQPPAPSTLSPVATFWNYVSVMKQAKFQSIVPLELCFARIVNCLSVWIVNDHLNCQGPFTMRPACSLPGNQYV